MSEPFKEELLAAWLAGEASPEEISHLLQFCRDDPTLLERAAELKATDRLLRALMVDAGAPAFVEEVAARCGLREPGGGPDLIGHVRATLSWCRRVQFAAAACFLMATLFGIWKWNQPVAVVVRLESAEWRGGTRALKVDEKLARGRYSLTRGFASLRFAQGAELLVEAPAEFHLLSAQRVRLRSGNVFAHVPPPATGFTVEGPTGRVIDKGTDFGVHVGPSEMEVHVVKGQVEAGQRGSPLRAVGANEALQMSALAVRPIPADSSRFLTALPPKVSRPINWIHWAFDENDGTATASRGAGLAAGASRAELSSLDGASSGPQWINGQFGSALSFDGQDDYVQTDFPGIGGGAARTVAFWVKVPRVFDPKNSYAMICWGSTRDLTEGWQISVNPHAADGTVGGLRVARMGGPVIGTTDLRDDRWHHAAVVFYGSEHPERSTQVIVYLDAELERTVRKGVLHGRTDTVSANSRKVAFGLNIGPANPNPALPPNWRVFRGCLDEVFICDAALDQGQLRELMMRNRISDFLAIAEE